MKSILVATLLLVLYSSASSQGTYPVFANLTDHSISTDAKFLGALGDRVLYFDRVNDKNKLWVTDGTENGTTLISPVDQTDMYLVHKGVDTWYFAEQRGTQYSISQFTVESDSLERIFSNGIRFVSLIYWQEKFAWIQSSAGSGYSRLQLYDPVAESLTTLVNAGYLDLRAIGSSDSHIYYIQSDDDGRKWLGKTDGTPGNAATFKELYGIGSSFDQQTRFFSDGQKVFFFYNPENDPFNLWTTDGTEAGTILLAAYQSPFFGWEDTQLFHNGKFYFGLQEDGAPSGFTDELHVTDGTPAGTLTLDVDEDYYMQPKKLTLYNNKVYFISSLYWSNDLRYTQGTIATTKLVLDAFGHQSGGVGFIDDLGTYNNKLVIQAYTEALGDELYLNDGTSTGTTLLSDVIRGETSSEAGNFVELGDRLFFTVNYANRNRLWIYDPAYTHSCDSFRVDSAFLVHITDTTTGSAQLFPGLGQQPFVYSLNGGTNTYNNTFTDLAVGVYTVDITDNQGCTLEYEFEIQEITSLEDSPAISRFTVSPNPLTNGNELQVEIAFASMPKNNKAQLHLYSPEGKLVLIKDILPGTDQTRIPGLELHPGIYMLILQNGENVLGVRKVIVN